MACATGRCVIPANIVYKYERLVFRNIKTRAKANDRKTPSSTWKYIEFLRLHFCSLFRTQMRDEGEFRRNEASRVGSGVLTPPHRFLITPFAHVYNFRNLLRVNHLVIVTIYPNFNTGELITCIKVHMYTHTELPRTTPHHARSSKTNSDWGRVHEVFSVSLFRRVQLIVANSTKIAHSAIKSWNFECWCR